MKGGGFSVAVAQRLTSFMSARPLMSLYSQHSEQSKTRVAASLKRSERRPCSSLFSATQSAIFPEGLSWGHGGGAGREGGSEG